MQRILYIGIALLGLVFTTEAQSGAWYRTQLLQQLGEANRLTLTPPPANISVVVGSCKGYPVTAEWESGIVSHLGIKLFEPEMKQAINKPLCDFAERYLLEELSCESPEEWERKRISDRVTPSGSPYSVIGQHELHFSINSPESGKYELCWENTNGQTLYTLTLPANWELISGEHKIEMENNLRQRLMKHPIDGKLPRTPKASRLEKTTTKGVVVYKRGHYMIPQMASALYYREEKQGEEIGYTLLEEPKYAAESLINLLSVPALAQNYTVQITQQKYGFTSESYTLNLSRLVSFCLDNGCHPYVGIEESNEHEIVAALLMVNPDWGYNHILKVTMKKSEIGRKNGALKATINAYTPTHNLETLYDDENIKKDSKAPKFTIKASR